MEGRVALVLVDAQINMFENDPPLYRAAEVLKTLKALIASARKTETPIFYIQHCGGPGEPDETDTPGWHIHPAIGPHVEDMILEKRKPDAFIGTALDRELEVRQIERIILAGMQTDMCINATCRRAVELGFAVTLVADGHSTFDSEEETAEAIVERYNQELGALAQVVPASAIL